NPADAAAREATGATVPPQSSPRGATESNPIYTVALPAPVSPVKTLFQYLGFVLGPLGTGALVLVFVVFTLLEREDLRDRLIRVVSHGRYTVTTHALDDAATRISRYMIAQSMVNGTYGLVIGTGLFLIGLLVGHGVMFPSFVLWGLLSATLRFIPYLGAWIAASFPIVLSLAVYPGFEVFVAVVVLLVGIELITNNVMEPWLYASSTGLSTMAVLIAAVFWTWLWGPVGLLLSTPLTVCIVVLGKHVPQLQFLDVLLGDQAALPPAVSFYQRLLAGDRFEAISVARETAREHGDDHVADEVLIPTLLMARRDRVDDDLSPEKETAVMTEMADVLPQLKTPSSTPSPTSAVIARVLGVSSHHRAEDLTLAMLGDLLTPVGVSLESASTRMLPSEIEQRIADDPPAVLFIAVLPPGGTVQARYLCRRLHRRFNDLKIVVGYFGKPRNFDQLLVRFRSAGASYVTTSLLQTRSQILALIPRAAVNEDSSVQPAGHP
ncbi:MAG: AI-2E family transporter, partial [Phycisphaerae bacterium]|nr:AI-2E family transporter [Phycisphaerae bacterium]